MEVKPLYPKLLQYLRKHNLVKKFNKQIVILKANPYHPSLNLEILEPKHRKLYSFRIDRKYRATFVVYNSEITILDISLHYQ